MDGCPASRSNEPLVDGHTCSYYTFSAARTIPRGTGIFLLPRSRLAEVLHTAARNVRSEDNLFASKNTVCEFVY